MSNFAKSAAHILSGCAAIGLMAFCSSARAEVLFDSLNSPTTGSMSGLAFQLDASFATGGSTFHATDVALLLSEAGTIVPGDTLDVTLVGGVPLADVTLVPGEGLNVGPGLDGAILGSATLPISDLSSNPTVEHFRQFGSIALKPNSFYWIDLTKSGPQTEEGPFVSWSTTSDNSGPGVSEGYNSSDATDFAFYPNNRDGGGQAFQMEVRGVTTVPELSTWALMSLGFAGLGFVGCARRSKDRPARRLGDLRKGAARKPPAALSANPRDHLRYSRRPLPSSGHVT